ncbi:MAG: DUF3788 family protein [Chloroflexota bacterium]|nr:DUF3788 family protein [Chloroflexota bacterium]
MTKNVFGEKNEKPDDELLAEHLGASFGYLEELRSFLHDRCDPVTEEWKFYGDKSGWQLKTLFK